MQKEEVLLGRLAVRHGLCTPEQVEECLRMQSMIGRAAPLGDLLVFKGYLTGPQLQDLLSRQHKKLMACVRCALSFTVLTLSEGHPIRCPKCRGLLVERSPEGPTRSDAELAAGAIGRGAPPAGPRSRHVCVICEETFEEGVDPSGRVRCPACLSTFTAKGMP